MSKKSVNESKEFNSNSDTKSVTTIPLNTHCIVCGTAFQTARVSKLYCSSRCKQFGFNHKNQIKEILSSKQRSINPQTFVFFIEDYNEYVKNQKLLKRYNQLNPKKVRWENAEQELIKAKKYDTLASEYTWSIYTTGALTENEEGELYDAEMELSESVLSFRPRDLSIEQWSFLKTLYPELDDTTFMETVISLSGDFFEELSLKMPEKRNDLSIIRNKYVNHCNMIALGQIRFDKKKEND